MNEVRQREPRLEVPRLVALAKDAPCMLRIPKVCNGNPATTVWCHSNQDRHGKGKGLKSHDCFGAFGCSACHDWIDNKVPNIPHEEKVAAFELGRDRTTLYLWRNQLVRVT